MHNFFPTTVFMSPPAISMIWESYYLETPFFVSYCISLMPQVFSDCKTCSFSSPFLDMLCMLIASLYNENLDTIIVNLRIIIIMSVLKISFHTCLVIMIILFTTVNCKKKGKVDMSHSFIHLTKKNQFLIKRYFVWQPEKLLVYQIPDNCEKARLSLS